VEQPFSLSLSLWLANNMYVCIASTGNLRDSNDSPSIRLFHPTGVLIFTWQEEEEEEEEEEGGRMQNEERSILMDFLLLLL
jgi:hypothetical protein